MAAHAIANYGGWAQAATTQRGEIVRFTPQSRNVVLNEPSYNWWPLVRRRLNFLCSLERGWDGYNAPPVSFEVASFALDVLKAVSKASTPMPTLVPGTAGNLQIEWNEVPASLELHILAPYDIIAQLHVYDDDRVEEREFQAVLTEISAWVDLLLEPAVDPRAAAL